MTSLKKSVSKLDIIGLIGVGNMGRCMLDRLLSAGYKTIAYDPSPGAQNYIHTRGSQLMTDALDLAKRSKLIIMSLPASKHVYETINLIENCLTCDQVIVDTSTVSPETSKECSLIAGKKGAGYVDSPILGRPSAVGNWLLPCGGSEDAIKFARPALETFAKTVIRVGDNGAGNTIKLLNQLMFSVINGITAEVMALTDIMGIDRETFYNVISNSGAATVSGLFKETAGRIVEGNYGDPTFTIELLCKDADLGIEMVKNAGANPLISGIVQIINENAKGKGLKNQDTSSLYKLYREFYTKIYN